MGSGDLDPVAANAAGIELRRVGTEELAGFFRAEGDAFGLRYGDEEVKRLSAGFEPGRSVAALEGGGVVATSASYGLEVTVPGSSAVAAGGVAFVGVLPTHRRRGLLRLMMRRVLDDIRSWGEPVALLTASEGGIYGRFGFGPATSIATYELRRLSPDDWACAAEDPGAVVLLDDESAARELPRVFDAVRRKRVGDVGRPAPWWEDLLRDDERRPGGANGMFVAGHRAPDGRIDGYALYRVARRDDGPACVRVQELCAESAPAEWALWRYVADLDLTDRLELAHRPLDEPLRWCLRDPRLLRMRAAGDHIWARLVDLPRALAARSYRHDVSLVLEVTDAFCPWNRGRWRLTSRSGSATVDRVEGESSDLVVDVADLGAAYLGSPVFAAMAHAGRVRELSPGASQRADAAFGTSPLPYCASDF